MKNRLTLAKGEHRQRNTGHWLQGRRHRTAPRARWGWCIGLRDLFHWNTRRTSFDPKVIAVGRHSGQLTTDGLNAYLTAVKEDFESEIDYAQLVRIYGGATRESAVRYSPAKSGWRVGPKPKRLRKDIGDFVRPKSNWTTTQFRFLLRCSDSIQLSYANLSNLIVAKSLLTL